MSEETVDVIRRWFRALERGDPAPAMCDPEIEIRNWAESPILGPYFGYEGLQSWWDYVADAFDDVRFQLEEIERSTSGGVSPCSAWWAASARPASRWMAPGRRS